MPNHLHVIIHFSKEGFNLNAIVGNAKRFMAYEIIHRLKIVKNEILLNHLRNLVSAREKKKGKLHIKSFDAKAIYSHKFLMQKINYIHNNPVGGKWMLAKDFTVKTPPG